MGLEERSRDRVKDEDGAEARDQDTQSPESLGIDDGVGGSSW